MLSDAHTRRSQSGPFAGGTAQRIGLPGNSVREIGERIKGGAVMDDKSPEKDAILITQMSVPNEWSGRTIEKKKRRTYDLRNDVQLLL